VYEVSDAARLETGGFVHAVDSPVAGRVAAVRHRLGDTVAAGDILFEIDPEKQRHELAEGTARVASQKTQIDAIRRELDTEAALRLREDAAAARQIAEAKARLREAAIAVDLARNESERSVRLRVSGLVSEMDVLRAAAEVEKRQALAEALAAAAARVEAEHQAQRVRSSARTAHLVHELETNAGELGSLDAHVVGLGRDLDERLIRAPIAGRVGGLGDRRVGSVVEAGTRLADLVPAGALRVRAYFAPSSVGRIRAGQPARLKVEAFPWTQWGVLEGRVGRVASESPDGRVEVEIDLDAGQGTSIPAQHGLVGTAEIEVERISPAVMVLRAAGARWAHRSGAAS
jgi:multidrug resistance efflux pump